MTRTQPLRRIFTRPWLLLGDSIAFLVFAALGRGSHDEATGLAAPLATLGTAAPFLAAWLLAAPLLGAYRVEQATPGLVARRTALAWLLAWPVALALRALIEQRGIPASFAVVAGTVNLVFLVGWRSLFALLSRRFA